MGRFVFLKQEVFMRDSIFYVSLRSFFKAMFTMLGLAIGFFLILLLIGLAQTTETTPALNFSQDIAPNALGERKILSKSSPVILKLNIEGTIGLENLTTENVQTMLTESREGDLKNDRVKAILLKINTPGGTVTDADGIYRAIKRYKEQYGVPVYAFVDGLCASGGMYVASAADKIFATNVSIVGSVGVLTPTYFNVYKLLEKIGIDALTITAGKGKDELNPTRPWVPGEEKTTQDLINYYYNYFVNVVTDARPRLSREKLINDYGAKIFAASQAVDFGFIDHADGSYEHTLKELLAKIGIEDDYYQVVELTKSSWLSTLFQASSSLKNGKVVHTLGFDELDPKMMNQYLYLYKP